MFAVWSRYVDVAAQSGFLRPWLRLGCTLLLFSLPFTFGGWAIYNSHMHALDRQSEHSARQAVTLMETMLAHAESANRSLFPFIDQPCEQALFTLRQQVALVPFVRTVNLVGRTGSTATRCSVPSSGRIGSSVTAADGCCCWRATRCGPTTPVGPARQPWQGAAFSTIDGEYLRFMLVLSGRPCTLLLRGAAVAGRAGRAE